MRALIAALVLAAVVTSAPAGAETVEFLYVEPDAGASGGGHSAIRFDGWVYHFRNAGGEGGGLLRMTRDDPDFFRYVYSVRLNRSIHRARVEVERDDWLRLRDGFADRLRVERKQFAVLESLQRDHELLAQLAETPPDASDDAIPVLALPGSGLFVGPGAEPAMEEQPSLTRLRGRLLVARGAGFLEERLAALRTELRDLAPGSQGIEPPTEGVYPKPALRFSQRFTHAAQRLVALEVLQRAAALEPAARREIQGPSGALAPDERVALERFAERLEERLLALPDGGRPDWGAPMLLGMARLAAAEESLRRGRWVVVDAFPDQAEPRPAPRVGVPEFLAELLAHEERLLAEARRELASAERPSERDYHAVESASNRVLELRAGLQHGAAIRMAPDPLMPSRAAARAVPLPKARGPALAGLASGAGSLADSYAEALHDLHGYRLLQRNCATEIFRTLDTTLGPEESRRVLGGHVTPEGFLRFIPVVAFRAVREHYRVAELDEIPSFRRSRLEAMAAREPRLAVFLREGNTLTSSLYRRDPADSLFVFFTEEAVLPRPLYGAFNLVAGLAESTLGLFQAPFDEGRRLAAGAKGVVFSLPELTFLSFRKGSMAYGRSEEPLTGPRSD